MYKVTKLVFYILLFFSVSKDVDAQIPPMYSHKEEYRNIRNDAINSGWQPRTGYSKTFIDKEFIQTTGFVELVSCSGTGRGFCLFEFEEKGYRLAIRTVPGIRSNKTVVNEPTVDGMFLLVPKKEVNSWQQWENIGLFKPNPIIGSPIVKMVEFATLDGQYGMWLVDCREKRYRIFASGGLNKSGNNNFYSVSLRRSTDRPWNNPSGWYQSRVISLVCQRY